MPYRNLILALALLLALAACAAPSPTPVFAPTIQPSNVPTSLPAPTATDIPTATPSPLADCAAPLGRSQANTSGVMSYQDPAGRFTVPIPIKWTAASNDQVLRLCSPDGGIRVYVLVVQTKLAASGIGEAWKRVQPGFMGDIANTSTTAITPGVDETLFVSYKTDASRVVQAIAQRVSGDVFVELVQATQDSMTRRNSQLQLVTGGLTMKGVKQVDLSQTTPKAWTADMAANLEKYIAADLQLAGIPGAEVAIVQNGRVVYLKGFGVRSFESGQPVTPDTRMMIGSTTKSMTTLMMGTLVDDGKLKWDTPAQKIYPSFAVEDAKLSATLTIRNLVCACTGVPRRDYELILWPRPVTPVEIIGQLRSFPFYTDFGEGFQYSNQMVAAGGYLATLAAGGKPDSLLADFEAQMQARVFEPIGMKNTTYDFDQVAASQDYATSYGSNLLSEFNPLPFTAEQVLTPVAPAGAAWSTARDMAAYVITQLKRGVSPEGKRVISAENLQVTWQPQVAVDAHTSYGLGWFIGDYKKAWLINHGGNTLGFTSDVAFLPDANLGVVVLANADSTNAFNAAIRTRVLELVYDQPSEADRSFANWVGSHQSTAADTGLRGVDPAGIAPYLGAYHNDDLGDFNLVLKDGRLYLATPRLSIELRRRVDDQGKESYVAFDSPLRGLPFTLAQAGGHTTVTFQEGAETYRFVK